MHYRTESISFSGFFNDVINDFYESEDIVKRLAKTLDFDVDKDFFLGIAILLPSNSSVSFEEKEKLIEIVSNMKNIPKINEKYREKAFFYEDYGVATVFVAHSKEELKKLLPDFKEEIQNIISNLNSEKKIRVGIGIPQTGISGIKKTCAYAQNAIKAGEIFKKDRTILEYMGMEIYATINAMITQYGKNITDIVFEQLNGHEIAILGKYYKNKEDVESTAQNMNIPVEEVKENLVNIKEKTGLDVNDSEDNFKLHLLVIAKKVLDKAK